MIHILVDFRCLYIIKTFPPDGGELIALFYDIKCGEKYLLNPPPPTYVLSPMIVYIVSVHAKITWLHVP